MDSGAEGPGFRSQSVNSFRQAVHTHCASVHQAAKLVAALLRVAGGNCRPVMAAYRRVLTYVTCRLTAKNRDQLRNLSLDNRVWASFYLLVVLAASRLAKS